MGRRRRRYPVVTAGNPGAGPVGGWQRPGEDDLGQLVHEVRVLAGRVTPAPASPTGPSPASAPVRSAWPGRPSTTPTPSCRTSSAAAWTTSRHNTPITNLTSSTTSNSQSSAARGYALLNMLNRRFGSRRKQLQAQFSIVKRTGPADSKRPLNCAQPCGSSRSWRHRSVMR